MVGLGSVRLIQAWFSVFRAGGRGGRGAKNRGVK